VRAHCGESGDSGGVGLLTISSTGLDQCAISQGIYIYIYIYIYIKESELIQPQLLKTRYSI
jgi:hypothetical protein